MLKVTAISGLLMLGLHGTGQSIQPAVSWQLNFNAVKDTAHKQAPLHPFVANDTANGVTFPEVNISGYRTAEEFVAYMRTMEHVKTVTPYVFAAKEVYFDLVAKEDSINHRQYRRYRKELEKEMRAKFEEKLKDLTDSDGRILFKLINRETGNNCYGLIKEVKGPFWAWFYQTVAKRWGYDLKEAYNPAAEPRIESIIRDLGPNYKMK
jgi:hypothetical protein